MSRRRNYNPRSPDDWTERQKMIHRLTGGDAPSPPTQDSEERVALKAALAAEAAAARGESE